MKLSNTIAGFCFGACALITALTPARSATWAVLVGVSKYQNSQIKSLKFPSKDAADLKNALVNIGKVPEANVLLLTDEKATRDNILAAVDQFLKNNVKPGDEILISLAGHGVAKGVGLDAKSYFLGTDARGASKEALESSAVSLRDLCIKVGEMPAAQFVLLDDACREDPIPGRGLKANNQSDTQVQDTRIVPMTGARANSVTFYACQVGQRAYEDPSKEHGVFTYYILEAIKNSAGADANGRIEMGRLASYVRTHVNEWAKAASIDQTPELAVTVDADTRAAEPIYVVNVGKASSTSFTPLKPQMVIDTEPETASVLVNGTKVSQLPVDLKEGSNTIRVEAPGFAPFKVVVNALPGYQYQMAVTLGAAGGGAAQPAQSKITVLVAKAQRAEQQQDWPAAQSAYSSLVQEEKYPPAYERLAALQQRQGRPDSLKDAIETLVKLNTETTPTPHTYNLLARAYSSYAQKEGMQAPPKEDQPKSNDDISVGGVKFRNPFGGKKKKQEPRAIADPEKAGDFRVPENGNAAAALSRKAADEAVKLNANDADSYLAQGFSLIGSDSAGKNAQDAISAFHRAVEAAPNSPTTNYGLGYALHHFSMFAKGNQKDQQLEEAITALDRAIQLKPNYYEALRVRGACHHLLGHGKQAAQDYDAALANSGSATDPDEVASINLSQSVLLRQQAAGEKGARKDELMKESDGYNDDAKEIARDLTNALRLLNRIGFGRSIADLLPRELRDPFSKLSNPQGFVEQPIQDLKNKVRGNFPGLPGF